jgi:bidirectional [NiFe] hydrogenase diaphorase subunit
MATATRPPGGASRRAPADEHPSGDPRFGMLDTALKRARFAPDHLIEVLHVAQEVFGHLSPDVLWYVAQALQLPPSRVQGVATFYHLFTFDPPGAHTCTVCTGTACFVQGADTIVDAVARRFDVAVGQTSPDGQLTLATARCLGSCSMAPVAVVDGEVRGHLDAAGVVDDLTARLAADAADGEDD